MPAPRTSTGHSKKLREKLAAARDRLGLTQQEVADRVTKDLELAKPLTAAAVSEWERFTRHPAIDSMAAWARAVGLHLKVELDDLDGDRIPVLLHPRTAATARFLDAATDEEFARLKTILELSAGVKL